MCFLHVGIIIKITLVWYKASRLWVRFCCASFLSDKGLLVCLENLDLFFSNSNYWRQRHFFRVAKNLIPFFVIFLWWAVLSGRGILWCNWLHHLHTKMSVWQEINTCDIFLTYSLLTIFSLTYQMKMYNFLLYITRVLNNEYVVYSIKKNH